MESNTPKILDGAIWTELINRGNDLPLPIWLADANLYHPEIVEEIHTGLHMGRRWHYYHKYV